MNGNKGSFAHYFFDLFEKNIIKRKVIKINEVKKIRKQPCTIIE